MTPNISELIRLFIFTAVAFVAAMAWTPLLTHLLYKYKIGKQIRADGSTPVYTQMHAKKSGTPVMGGLLIWVTASVLALFFWILSVVTTSPTLDNLNFLSRSQTWLPFGALIASALVGAVDDIMNVRKIGPKGGGLSMRHRLVLYTLIAVAGAWWFYYKLGFSAIHIPGGNYFGLPYNLELGWWYIPVFIFVVVATAFSVNETDGLDGLAGGTLLSAFAAFSVIAFVEGKTDLAVFCGVLVGGLLAFLWFNIPPARFFMGDTGVMALGVTLAIVAFLTNSVLVLPVIGFVFVVESLSVIIQTISKKIRGKKIFHSTPIHHHFEAMGWPEYKIVMRFWVIAGVTAAAGLVIGLIGRG